MPFYMESLPLLLQFIEVTEIEVSSLHEGNFPRFKIRPSDFSKFIKFIPLFFLKTLDLSPYFF